MSARKKTSLFDKIPEPAEKTSDEKPKINNVIITCPYCDEAAQHKIRYSLSSAVPNLLECPECKYHFIAMQSTEIRLRIIEIQEQIEKEVAKANAGPIAPETRA